ncbi:hypothetical protein O6H91_04G012100 [Diphasiastrum complanatum]|nr:hypothetical protein O6H91_04G012100 [Diphasiastrum complanatum]
MDFLLLRIREEFIHKALVFLLFFRIFDAIRDFRKSPAYGRHLDSTFNRLGKMSAKVGWILMESPAVFVTLAVFFKGQHNHEIVPRCFLALFEAHYIHRTFIFPMGIKTGATRMPIVTAMMASLFNALNGYIQGRWISHYGYYPTQWLTAPQFLFGIVIFATGMLINIWADRLLLHLRASSQEKVYKVPHGGLFEYVTCPNYLGEILEWLGWSIMTWSSTGLGFFVSTVCFLGPRANAHHDWYLKKFSDYPQSRKSLIPFLW